MIKIQIILPKDLKTKWRCGATLYIASHKTCLYPRLWPFINWITSILTILVRCNFANNNNNKAHMLPVTGTWQIFILAHTDVSIIKYTRVYHYYYWFIDCINAHYYIITISMRAAIDRYVIDFFVITGRYYYILKVTVLPFYLWC
jgi:hypothetical protein